MQTKIILGTVQFGLAYGINNTLGKPGEETVAAILDLASNNGINLLDTAEAYGDSQEVIGRYHAASRNTFKIITKFSAKREDLAKDLHTRILQDLSTLHTKALYCYMFHSFHDFETYYPAYKDEIRSLKEKGLIEKFGVSIYTNAEFEKLLTYENIDLVQLPFNLLDNNSRRSALILKAKAKNIEVHTRSVFLQGLFFKNIAALPAKLNPLAQYLEAITELLKANNLNLNDLALNYVVQQNNIDHVLIGVDNSEQLQSNLTSLQHKIPASVMLQVDALSVSEAELLNPSNWN